MMKYSQQNQVHSASNQRRNERSKTARKELAMKAGETIAKKHALIKSKSKKGKKNSVEKTVGELTPPLS
jgi:hypothetical protein